MNRKIIFYPNLPILTSPEIISIKLNNPVNKNVTLWPVSLPLINKIIEIATKMKCIKQTIISKTEFPGNENPTATVCVTKKKNNVSAILTFGSTYSISTKG